MDFNCSDCISKNDQTAPSIVVTVIDEFHGTTYGKYCNSKCAKEDLNAYFDGEKNPEIVEPIDDLNDQLIQELTSPNTKVLDKDLWTKLFLDQMNLYYLDMGQKKHLTPVELSKRSDELNEIWESDLVDNKIRCAILAYWLSTHDETKNLNVSDPELTIFPNHILNGAAVTKAGTTPVVVTKMGHNEFLISAPSDKDEKPSSTMVLKSEVKFY